MPRRAGPEPASKHVERGEITIGVDQVAGDVSVRRMEPAQAIQKLFIIPRPPERADIPIHRRGVADERVCLAEATEVVDVGCGETDTSATSKSSARKGILLLENMTKIPQ